MKKILQLSLLALTCCSLTSCGILASILHVPAYFLNRIVEVEDGAPSAPGSLSAEGYQTIEVAVEASELSD